MMGAPVGLARGIIAEATTKWAMATVGNIVVGVFRDSFDSQDARRIVSVLNRAANLYPGNCAYLLVVESTSPSPDADARKIAQQGMIELGTKLRCVATVIEGSSMKAATVRLVTAAITLFGGSQQETEYFSNLGDALAWFRSRLATIPASLLVEVEKVRAAIQPARPST